MKEISLRFAWRRVNLIFLPDGFKTKVTKENPNIYICGTNRTLLGAGKTILTIIANIFGCYCGRGRRVRVSVLVPKRVHLSRVYLNVIPKCTRIDADQQRGKAILEEKYYSVKNNSTVFLFLYIRGLVVLM